MIHDLDILEIEEVAGGNETPGWNVWDNWVWPIIRPMYDVNGDDNASVLR